MSKNKNRIEKIALFGVGIALYIVLGMSVKVPLIGHIQTDLGYIVFGLYLYIFGWPAAIIGVIGCIMESLLVNGWFPAGWALGQVVIGVVCGIVYKHSSSKIIHAVVTILSVFIGIAVIKTAVECALYGIPWPVKFTKNAIAFIADTMPMLIGLWLSYRLKKRLVKGGENNV